MYNMHHHYMHLYVGHISAVLNLVNNPIPSFTFHLGRHKQSFACVTPLHMHMCFHVCL